MLDTRSQRTDQAAEDSFGKSMLGSIQLAWLKMTLLEAKNNADIKWQFIVSSVSANTEARQLHTDHWDGYLYEAYTLREWMEAEGFNDGSTIMSSGDFHTGEGIDNGCNNRFDLPELGVATTNLAGGNQNLLGTWTEGVNKGSPGYAVVHVDDQIVNAINKDKQGNTIRELVIQLGVFDNNCDPADFDGGTRCSYEYAAFTIPSEGECADLTKSTKTQDYEYSPPFPSADTPGCKFIHTFMSISVQLPTTETVSI